MAGISGSVGCTGAPRVRKVRWPATTAGTPTSRSRSTPTAMRCRAANRNRAGDIATYMNRNPSQRIALDNSNTRRIEVVRATLIDAGVSAYKIQSGAFGDPQFRRDGRVEVLVSNQPDLSSLRRDRTARLRNRAVFLFGLRGHVSQFDAAGRHDVAGRNRHGEPRRHVVPRVQAELGT